LLEPLLEVVTALVGFDYFETHWVLANLAHAYRGRGDHDKALRTYAQLVESQSRMADFGADHPATLTSMMFLGRMHVEMGNLAEATPLLERTLKGMRAKYGPHHVDTLITIDNLALAYEEAGKHHLAEPLLRELVAARRLKASRGPAPLTSAQAVLALNLLAQEKFIDAEEVIRECLIVREKAHPDEWSTFNTKSMLGASLLEQKKHAEAEPLLLAGYEGMKQREAKIPLPGKPRLAEALERLVRLYEETNKPGEAAKWRAELKKRQATNKPQSKNELGKKEEEKKDVVNKE
jgi:tetratricopeptide (TPR) repeat protein